MTTRNKVFWAFVLLMAPAGCAVNDRLGVNPLKDRPPTGAVTRIEALWTDTVLRDGSKPVARGFAGRVFLFEAGSDAPIVAPGRIDIYTFDEREESGKPKTVWQFESDQLQKVRDKSLLGWSHALWIPWEYGAEPAACTLVVRYTAPDGRVVVSSPGKVRLPGVPGAKPASAEKISARVSANRPNGQSS